MRRRDGGLDDAVHVLAVLDEQCRQLAQSAQQDQCQRAGDRAARPARWNPGLSLMATSMSVSCSIASAMQRPGQSRRAPGASRIQLSVMAGRDSMWST